MNKQPVLNIIEAKKLDSQLLFLIKYLGLNSSDARLMKYKKDFNFDAEPNCCHLNVWVKIMIDRGKPQFGWLLAQDKSKGVSEAQFHSVWQSPEGELLDVTPRENNAKRVMFIPDLKRVITLSKHNGQPKITSYNNVLVVGNKIINGIERIRFSPQSEMMQKYALEKIW